MGGAHRLAARKSSSPGRAAVALAAALIALGAAHPARAQEAAAAARPGPWRFELTPYGWFAGLGGSVRTPFERAPGRDVNASFGDVLGDVSGIPIMGMAEVRYGRFGVVADLLHLGLESDFSTRDVLFRGGDARVNTTIGSVVGLFRAVDLPNQSFDIGGGARIWSVRTKLSLNPGLLPGGTQKDSTTWADPLLAARYHLDLTQRFGLTAYGDIGGFGAGSTLTWQAIGSLDYRATESVVLRAGWRYLTFDKKRGDFRLDLDFSGPFVAATFRF
jgi:opacity protein-like surface antigen